MFQTPADAQAAIDRLAAEGLAGDAIITDRTADGANAGVNSEGGNTGLWGSLKGLFAPDDEVHGFAEGVRRGHALLVIHPAIDTRNARHRHPRGIRPDRLRRPAGAVAHRRLAAACARSRRTTGAGPTGPATPADPNVPARPVGARDPARGTAGVRVYTAGQG